MRYRTRRHWPALLGTLVGALLLVAGWRASETTVGAISPLLELAALLSINLGIMNLLPLPMLDGGRIFFLLIEVVRGGKRIAPEREAIVHTVGFVAFIVLAIVVTSAIGPVRLNAR